MGACYGRPHTRAGTVNTIGVASLDDALQQVHEAGGKTVLPRLAIPGVGYLAHCQDTEGNTFGTMQANPSAKQRACQTTVARRVFSTANPLSITVNYLKMRGDVFEEMDT